VEATLFAVGFSTDSCMAQQSTMVDDPTAPLAPPDPPEVSGLIEGSDAWTTEPAVKGKRHEFGTGVALPTGDNISHFESHCATNGTQQGDNVSNLALKTTIRQSKATKVSQVLSHMQRMASDRTKFLEKVLKIREKQARRAQHATREAEKAANKTRKLQLQMLSMLKDCLQSHSNVRHRSKNKSPMAISCLRHPLRNERT
jgi:hypothetical protein